MTFLETSLSGRKIVGTQIMMMLPRTEVLGLLAIRQIVIRGFHGGALGATIRNTLGPLTAIGITLQTVTVS